MKKRTLLELYRILLTHLESRVQNYFGLCYSTYNLMDRGIITRGEYTLLDTHLDEHKPTKENQYKHFTLSKEWNQTENAVYWWRNMEYGAGINVRIEFIKEVIKNLEDKQKKVG